MCVFIGGKGGGGIQQEPKDNSGHLTGIVCMYVCICGGVCLCVHWGWGGGIQQEPKDNSGHLTGIVCVCLSVGGGEILQGSDL